MRAVNDEQALIASAVMLRDKHGVINLEPAEFESGLWARMWAWMQERAEIDPVEFESAFLDHRQAITDAIANLPAFSEAGMRKMAERIRKAAHRRRVARALANARKMLEAGGDIAAAGDCVLSAIDNVGSDDGWRPLGEHLVAAYQDIERAQLRGENCNFVPTGLRDFDREFGGLQKDGLIVVAGRPGMGKSAFAALLARNAARRAPVLMVSMEMSGRQLAMRYFASEAGVCMQKMMQGRLNPGEWARLSKAQLRLMDAGIHINDRRSRTVADVVAEARRFARVHKRVGMVVVDYLGLMEMPDARNKADAVGEVTRRLAGLAGEIGCPVVVLSQLNRELERRTDKKPVMADLRDSGAIEQDAHQIIFLFRPEVYDDDPQYEGIALIDLAKNRNGSTGSVQMRWVAEAATFADLDSGFDDDEAARRA